MAVFVTGKAWQFRNWKWDNPVELLHHGKLFSLVLLEAPFGSQGILR